MLASGPESARCSASGKSLPLFALKMVSAVFTSSDQKLMALLLA